MEKSERVARVFMYVAIGIGILAWALAPRWEGVDLHQGGLAMVVNQRTGEGRVLLADGYHQVKYVWVSVKERSPNRSDGEETFEELLAK